MRKQNRKHKREIKKLEPVLEFCIRKKLSTSSGRDSNKIDYRSGGLPSLH